MPDGNWFLGGSPSISLGTTTGVWCPVVALNSGSSDESGSSNENLYEIAKNSLQLLDQIASQLKLLTREHYDLKLPDCINSFSWNFSLLHRNLYSFVSFHEDAGGDAPISDKWINTLRKSSKSVLTDFINLHSNNSASGATAYDLMSERYSRSFGGIATLEKGLESIIKIAELCAPKKAIEPKCDSNDHKRSFAEVFKANFRRAANHICRQKWRYAGGIIAAASIGAFAYFGVDTSSFTDIATSLCERVSNCSSTIAERVQAIAHDSAQYFADMLRPEIDEAGFQPGAIAMEVLQTALPADQLGDIVSQAAATMIEMPALVSEPGIFISETAFQTFPDMPLELNISSISETARNLAQTTVPPQTLTRELARQELLDYLSIGSKPPRGINGMRLEELINQAHGKVLHEGWQATDPASRSEAMSKMLRLQEISQILEIKDNVATRISNTLVDWGGKFRRIFAAVSCPAPRIGLT